MTECLSPARTGFPVTAGTDQEGQSFGPLFDHRSDRPESDVFESVDFGILLQGFNLPEFVPEHMETVVAPDGGTTTVTVPPTEYIEVEMVAGAGPPVHYQPIILNGRRLWLTSRNNVLFLPWPFRYRLVYHGSALGSFTVYQVPTPFEYMNAVAVRMNREYLGG